MSKAVFLDRDCIIPKDVLYCNRPEDLRLFPKVGDGMRLLNKSGFKVILITNQSGVARGYFTEEALGSIHEKMLADLRRQGAWIDAIYYCPHHPDDCCNCRKPNTDMLEKASREWNIDLRRSYFIGDKFLDLEAANRAGCKAVLVPISEPEVNEPRGGNGFKGALDFVSSEFYSAVEWVLTSSTKADDVSIIIPTKNEEHNLPYILPMLPPDAEVILVDGHSTDRTIELARKLRPDIIVLTQPGRGKGDAMRYGFKQAGRDFIITFDADGSFSTGEIDAFAAPLRKGYDLVKGSRFIRGGATLDMPLLRRLGNWAFVTLANLLFGTRYTDLAYGFHAFRRSILEKVILTSDGFEIDTELYIKAKKAGLRIVEVPSCEYARIKGEGKLQSFPDGWRILKTIIRERIGSQG